MQPPASQEQCAQMLALLHQLSQNNAQRCLLFVQSVVRHQSKNPPQMPVAGVPQEEADDTPLEAADEKPSALGRVGPEFRLRSFAFGDGYVG